MSGPNGPGAPNRTLAPFAFLVGEWELEISNGSFLARKEDRLRGRAEFAWIENGAFLVERNEFPRDQLKGVWLTGFDALTKRYTVLYYDTNFGRQDPRVYEAEMRGDVWRKWRLVEGTSQRFEGTFDRGMNEIRGHWGDSKDGVHWNHDFDLTYRKTK